MAYDHLVLALGAVSSFVGMSDVQAAAFEFKSLADAIRIRNHVIDLFERADSEGDPEVRGPMLTFVVAGGGFAGAELAGALNDFTRGILAYYPNIPHDEVKVVLVHSRERILPELSGTAGGVCTPADGGPRRHVQTEHARPRRPGRRGSAPARRGTPDPDARVDGRHGAAPLARDVAGPAETGGAA